MNKRVLNLILAFSIVGFISLLFGTTIFSTAKDFYTNQVCREFFLQSTGGGGGSTDDDDDDFIDKLDEYDRQQREAFQEQYRQQREEAERAAAHKALSNCIFWDKLEKNWIDGIYRTIPDYKTIFATLFAAIALAILYYKNRNR